MERATPVRKSHTSTAELLFWPENQNAHSSPYDPSSAPRSANRMPSDGVSKVLCGAQVTEEEEAQSLSKLKPCSGYKMKEMTGSGIFVGDGENGGEEAGSANQTPNRTGLRIYQQAVSGISQISFSVDESVSPKKPTSQAEVAKQRELSGTLETEVDTKLGVQSSKIKWQELSGHDIFGPPPEITIRPLDARALELKGSINMGESAPRNVSTSFTMSSLKKFSTLNKIQKLAFYMLLWKARKLYPNYEPNAASPMNFTSSLLVIRSIEFITCSYKLCLLFSFLNFSFLIINAKVAGGQSAVPFSEETPVKTAKKTNNQKFQELTGNNIFKGDTPSGTDEKSLSNAKLREMSGSNIFADGKAESREHLGARKPPGGDSSIALV
ncbi:hypothetical protein C5167_008220 [Papaver somniferum]|uniref:DUF4057 domain-containing protein n=1 Tax=Papaver somniferum TaxID=3469 RepID=A0A4Y7JXT1_PAPSO|nr:hypothetical protein C5167_008220 [Papaver somniferum]